MSTTEKQRIINTLNGVSKSVIRMSIEVSSILDSINLVYLREDNLTDKQVNVLTTLYNSIRKMQCDTIRAETMTATLKQSVYMNLKKETDKIKKGIDTSSQNDEED